MPPGLNRTHFDDDDWDLFTRITRRLEERKGEQMSDDDARGLARDIVALFESVAEQTGASDARSRLLELGDS